MLCEILHPVVRVLQWTHWRSYWKQLICSSLASYFSGKATKVGRHPKIPKLISQLWGIPQPQYFITLLLEAHWTYFWKHYIYHKKDTKIGSQNFGYQIWFCTRLVNKSIYPCGFCELRVNWSHKALCCDSCSLWYHKTCLSMASGDFAHSENESNTSWHCIKCRTPLSDTYHSYDIPVNNMFDTLASIPGDDSVFNRSTVSASSPSAPLRHSSPYSTRGSHKSSPNDSVPQGPPPKKRNNLRLCILNCNSARNGQAELEFMAEYTKPDIIFITETKIMNQWHQIMWISAR